MLRTIKSHVGGARLLGFSATTAGSAINTVQVGRQEGAFTNAVADSRISLAFKTPFARPPIVVACPGPSFAVGGGVNLQAATTASVVTIQSFDATPSAAVGAVEALVVGYSNSSTTVNATKNNLFQSVSGNFQSAMIVSGQVAANGTKVIGGSTFTSVKNSDGNYTVTFTRAFGRTPVVVASVKAISGRRVQIESKSNNSFTVKTFSPTDTPADVIFNFVAYGSASIHEVRLDKGSEVQTGFRKPRLLAFRILISGGVPSVNIGAGMGTVVDTGVGQITLNYTEPFAREPIVLVFVDNTVASSFPSLFTSSASSCLIETSNTGGSVGDRGEVNVIVIGSDDATEY